MNIHDIATKSDLISLEKQLRQATKDDLTALEKRLQGQFVELEKRMDTKLDGLEVRMDVKIDYMCRKVVDDITGVISDFMEHADARFRRLEVATGQPQGWQKPFKRLKADR